MSEYINLLEQKNQLKSQITQIDDTLLLILIQEVVNFLSQSGIGYNFNELEKVLTFRTKTSRVIVNFFVDRVSFKIQNISGNTPTNTDFDSEIGIIIDTKQENIAKTKKSLFGKVTLPFQNRNTNWFPEKQTLDEFFQKTLPELVFTKNLG